MEEEITNQMKNQTSATTRVDFDKLLSSAGELGKFQLYLALATFPFYLFGVFGYFSQLFMTVVPPEHWCWIPELKNLTEHERRKLAIPRAANEFGYSFCESYDANWTDVLASRSVPDNLTTIPCQYGWEFNRSYVPYSTISTELEWVCDKKNYQATAQSIFFAGSVVGGILVGWVSDCYGRIPATITSNLLGCVGGLASTFAVTLTQFAVCRFVMGMMYDTGMMIPYLIILEYTSPKYRSLLANASFAIFFSLFGTSYPFIALACGNWKILSLVSSLPLAFAIFTPMILPESPIWLLSKNRVDDVISKIQEIGRVNQKEVPSQMITQFKVTIQTEPKEDQLGIYDLFKNRLLRKNIILVCLVHMVGMTIFDCLFRNLEQLKFDFFLSFAACSATELPSLLLCAVLADVLGRRCVIVSMLVINSIACILIAFVNAGVPTVVCAVVARFVINVSINTALQWSAEMLPTAVRGSGVSLQIICGNIAVIMSPFIALTKAYSSCLPYVVMACLAACGAMAAVTLPETAKRELPKTFNDAENLAKSQELRFMSFFKTVKKKKDGQTNLGFSTNA